MPGSIKVSGAQKTIAAPYVKVSGTWRPAASAYVKVAGTWRQWYAAEITDNFNRTDSSSLGTTSNGITSWSNPNPVYQWSIVDNTAHIGVGAGVNSQLSTVTSLLNSPNYELRVDTPEGYGPGVAFWVQDWLNWWSVTTDILVTANYSCPGGGTLNGTNCDTSSTYPATGTSYNNGNFTPGTQTINASVVSQQVNATCSGYYGSCTYNGVAGYCTYYTCYIDVYSCPNEPGWTLEGDKCTRIYNTCPAGGSDPCSTGTSYSCNSGDTRSGTTCTHVTSVAATNTPSYTYYTRLKRRTAGTISTVATYTHTSAVRSLKVVTSNDTITMTAYSGAGQTGLLNTNTYVDSTSATKTAVAGILMQAANASQGYYVDNFYMK